MKIKFTKMQGAGNDFVVIDDMARGIDVTGPLAEKLLDRRFGVGADQLLLLRSHKNADFEMKIHNADGSEVEMCGNGIRCAAIYARSRGIVERDDMAVITGAGVIRPTIVGDMVKVDMGEPQFDGPQIPVDMKGEIMGHPLEAGGKKFLVNCLSMGNPHCVIYVDDADSIDVAKYGPKIERHPLFPRRINVEFIEKISEKEIKMRVWERGSGETLACGTGASAAAVMSARKGLTGRSVNVRLRGGLLLIEWEQNGRVMMTGPAEEVFTGEIEVDIKGPARRKADSKC